ncbi:hypothetical protein HY312_04635 [Candidatus Saccharibacteria bacterium]|nr:hypothetical protein [Candidatus Saccharibacteria bacterium]
MTKNIKKMLRMLAVPVFVLGLGVFTTALQPVTANAQGGQDLSISGGAGSAKGNDQQTDLFGETGVFKIITNVLLFVIGAVSVIMLIIGGIRYVVSGGDSTAVQNAKNTILYAIVGVVVAILAYAVVNFVLGAFTPTGSVSQ